ncbi:MAG: N-acetylmuramoyl-L-alanine amidase, partial [Verrucomicrobiales bacterium]|nr:N-acetylmuramoyl-L-alanine amidase [Verrucomicrobiales bacterium]
GRAVTNYSSETPVPVFVLARFHGAAATTIFQASVGSGDVTGGPGPGTGGPGPNGTDGPGPGTGGPGLNGTDGPGTDDDDHPEPNGQSASVRLKGRQHETRGGTGSLGEYISGNDGGTTTVDKIVSYSANLIRVVYEFDDTVSEERTERRTVSGSSGEELKEARRQWEANGWSVDGGITIETEPETIETQGSVEEYVEPYGIRFFVEGPKGVENDSKEVEFLATAEEMSEIYRARAETQGYNSEDDLEDHYWTGPLKEMGFLKEVWTKGQRIAHGANPYRSGAPLEAEASYGNGAVPSVKWSELWLQSEVPLPEGRRVTRTFLIHASQETIRIDDSEEDGVDETDEAEPPLEWFGTLSLEIVPQESISTEAASVNVGTAGPASAWISTKSDGTILLKPPFERGKRNRIRLLPVEVVELAPKLRDFETGDDIEGSEVPDLTDGITNPMVERNPVQDRIAHRDIKIKIGDGDGDGDALEGKKVTWNMEALFTPPESGGRVFRGDWSDSPNHPNRFEASTEFDTYGFQSVSQAQGQTEIDDKGYTAIRANLPPVGFNKAQIKIQIEGSNEFIELIDMEVPAIVVIDPGHGGDQDRPGSSWNNATSPSGVLEKNMTLQYGRALRDSLEEYAEENDLQIRVAMTRDSDVNYSGQERANIARDLGADIFQSFHFNAANGTARGSESLIRGTSNVNEDEDEALGRRVLDGVLEALGEYDEDGINDRGVKNYAWSASQGANVPSSWSVLADPSYSNVADYHPVRGNILEVEFIDVEAVDDLLNGEDAEAIRTSVGEDVRDAIIEDINHQP